MHWSSDIPYIPEILSDEISKENVGDSYNESFHTAESLHPGDIIDENVGENAVVRQSQPAFSNERLTNDDAGINTLNILDAPRRSVSRITNYFNGIAKVNHISSDSIYCYRTQAFDDIPKSYNDIKDFDEKRSMVYCSQSRV